MKWQEYLKEEKEEKIPFDKELQTKIKKIIPPKAKVKRHYQKAWNRYPAHTTYHFTWPKKNSKYYDLMLKIWPTKSKTELVISGSENGKNVGVTGFNELFGKNSNLKDSSSLDKVIKYIDKNIKEKFV